MTGTIDHTVINLTVFVLAVFVGYHVVWTDLSRTYNSLSALNSDFPAVLNAALGTKFKLVLGYPGSREIGLAIDKQEVYGACGLAWPSISVTAPGFKGAVRNNVVLAVAQTEVERRREARSERRDDRRCAARCPAFQRVFRPGRRNRHCPGRHPE